MMFRFLLITFLCAAAVSAEDLDQLATTVRVREHESRWRNIPWSSSAKDAWKTARSENRPLFVWTASGPPLEHC